MGSIPCKSHGSGDATGVRSGPLAKMVLYYKTHLAYLRNGGSHAFFAIEVPRPGIECIQGSENWQRTNKVVLCRDYALRRDTPHSAAIIASSALSFTPATIIAAHVPSACR